MRRFDYDEFREEGVSRALTKAEVKRSKERRRGVRRPVRTQQVERLRRMERETE